MKKKLLKVLDKLNPYPEYLEKGHLTDGSEECYWEDRNKKIVDWFSKALAKARENGWQTGYQQCKEDKEGLK